MFSRWFEQVSDEGDVLYVFPKDYRSKLAAKSFRIKLEPFVEKAKVLISHYVSCGNSKCKFIKVMSDQNVMLSIFDSQQLSI